MIYEDVYDPVEVISLFRHGKIQPLRFRWNERVYKVSKINGGWVSDEGINRIYHFSVLSEGPDCFELTFDSRNMAWELTRVCMEG
ncbi:MAG: hypothetical protein GY863_16585 [bacterium]|nr:hypothetical protein [bacterium]